MVKHLQRPICSTSISPASYAWWVHNDTRTGGTNMRIELRQWDSSL
jgi:hypothetical protein